MDATSDLRVFVRVMDRGSFSAAAKDLGLTPSAVSKLVSRLEDRLGARLLERSTRRLALTPEGETLLARARRIVADVEEAEAEVMSVRGAPRGRLHVNSGTAFGLHQLAPGFDRDDHIPTTAGQVRPREQPFAAACTQHEALIRR